MAANARGTSLFRETLRTTTEPRRNPAKPRPGFTSKCARGALASRAMRAVDTERAALGRRGGGGDTRIEGALPWRQTTTGSRRQNQTIARDAGRGRVRKKTCARGRLTQTTYRAGGGWSCSWSSCSGANVRSAAAGAAAGSGGLLLRKCES